MNFINKFFNELLFKDKQVEGFMVDVADGLDDVAEHIASVKSVMHDEADPKSISRIALERFLCLLISVLSVILMKYMLEHNGFNQICFNFDIPILPNIVDKVLVATIVSRAIKNFLNEDYLDYITFIIFIVGLSYYLFNFCGLI